MSTKDRVFFSNSSSNRSQIESLFARVHGKTFSTKIFHESNKTAPTYIKTEPFVGVEDCSGPRTLFVRLKTAETVVRGSGVSASSFAGYKRISSARAFASKRALSSRPESLQNHWLPQSSRLQQIWSAELLEPRQARYDFGVFWIYQDESCHFWQVSTQTRPDLQAS